MTTATPTAAEYFQEAAAEFEIELREYERSDRDTPRPEWWMRLAEAIDAAVQPNALEPHQHTHGTHLVEAYLMQGDEMEGRPRPGIQRAWQELREAKAPDPHPLESLADLIQMPGMSNDQIVRMTGLDRKQIAAAAKCIADRRSGLNPDMAPLQYPKGHVAPQDRDRAARAIQEAREFKAAIGNWKARPKYGEETAANWNPPVESVEELLSLPGMSLDQVARMHHLTVAEVAAIRDGRTTAPMDPNGPIPAEMIEDEIRRLHDVESLLTPAELAERLGVDVALVKRTIKGTAKK